MGPRQKSLGNQNTHTVWQYKQQASMGPRQKSLGNHFLSCLSTILLPASMGPRQKSLGNGESATGVGLATEVASMGPRQKSLGNPSVMPWIQSPIWPLQWGRGKKASEILLLCLCAGPNDYASMGPRQKSLGNYYANNILYYRTEASMGPRQKSLGNLIAQKHG